MDEGENPNQLNQHSSLENPNTQEEYEAMEQVLLGVASNPASTGQLASPEHSEQRDHE